MMLYTFDSTDEFVAYLDTRAKEMRNKAKNLHPRSHARARFDAGAAEIESIATMVRGSNLVAVQDFHKLAASGAA